MPDLCDLGELEVAVDTDRKRVRAPTRPARRPAAPVPFLTWTFRKNVGYGALYYNKSQVGRGGGLPPAYLCRHSHPKPRGIDRPSGYFELAQTTEIETPTWQNVTHSQGVFSDGTPGSVSNCTMVAILMRGIES